MQTAKPVVTRTATKVDSSQDVLEEAIRRERALMLYASKALGGCHAPGCDQVVIAKLRGSAWCEKHIYPALGMPTPKSVGKETART